MRTLLLMVLCPKATVRAIKKSVETREMNEESIKRWRESRKVAIKEGRDKDAEVLQSMILLQWENISRDEERGLGYQIELELRS